MPAPGEGLPPSRNAGRALAAMVTPEDLAETAVYPQLSRIRECSFAVACATIRRAV